MYRQLAQFLKHSFLPSTLRDWNSLDLNARHAPTLCNFKHQVNQTLNEGHIQNNLTTIHTTRAGQMYHSRMRLECSSLKHLL